MNAKPDFALLRDRPFDDTIVFSRSRRVAVDPQRLEDNRILAPGGIGKAGPSFKMLRTQLLRRLKDHGVNTVGIVSPTPHDGKTFTAINLAVAIAGHEGHTALLVDMDLRRPSVHRRFGLAVEQGVEQVLRDECSIPDALVNPEGYDRLLVLPTIGPVLQSSELLATGRAQRIAAEIKARYPNRIVIYDLPPVLDSDDALTFLPMVDAALLVIGEQRTRREDVTRCLELLEKIPIAGTVLNGTRSRSASRYAY
jgi:Mrp family chromosome partitioning ATPase